MFGEVHQVKMVVNYRLPKKVGGGKFGVFDEETFVHRCGRTGRNGQQVRVCVCVFAFPCVEWSRCVGDTTQVGRSSS